MNKRAPDLATASLMLAVVVWGTVLGGFLYSHLVFFPAFLSDLPGSAVLVNGRYPLKDGRFWSVAHAGLFLVLPATLVLNWKSAARRRLIAESVAAYLLAFTATALYFVPELLEFARSPVSSVAETEWLARGLRWQRLSWLRGGSMYAAFVPLLLALARPFDPADQSLSAAGRRVQHHAP